jgi:acetyl esterase
VTNAAFDTASYDDFAEGHFLTRNMMKWFWDSYTTDPGERQDVFEFSEPRSKPRCPR